MKNLIIIIWLVLVSCDIDQQTLSVRKSLVSTPHIIAEPSNTPDTYFGRVVLNIGDANGDQYKDLLIMGYSEQEHGDPAFYRGFYNIYFYSGSPSGISTEPSQQFLENTDLDIITSGDFNGDGLMDLFVGKRCSSEDQEGCDLEYMGSTNWYSSLVLKNLSNLSQVSTGDFNNDGYDDIIGGDPVCKVHFDDDGCAFVFNGSPEGIVDMYSWKQSHPEGLFQHYFGSSVSSAGDVNGDGFGDAIIGEFPEDGKCKVFVFHGSRNGLESTTAMILDPPDNQRRSFFGWDISQAGDINKDGYSDVIIGADSWDGDVPNEGRAYIYYGSAAGLDNGKFFGFHPPDRDATMFGFNVSSAGDVNGDGYSDVMIASYWSGEAEREGRVYVYHGGSDGLSKKPSWWADPADEKEAWFGGSMAPLGDVNGDGYDDVVIGAPGRYPGGAKGIIGRAHVYYGSPQGLLPCVTCDLDAGDAGADAGKDAGQPDGHIADRTGDGNCDCRSGSAGMSGVIVIVSLGLFAFSSRMFEQKKQKRLPKYQGRS